MFFNTIQQLAAVARLRVAGGGGLTTISAHPTLGTGLAHYYKLDTDANDSVGSKNGSVSGAVLTTGSGGILGECYTFDGVNDDINLVTTYGSLIDGSADFSYSFWFKSNTLPTASFDTLLNFRGENKSSCELRYDSGNVVIEWTPGVLTQIRGTTSLSSGTWYHCIITYSATNGSVVYINNSSEGSDSSIGSFGSNSTGSSIGSYNSSSLYWHGEIDEFGIWSKVLSADERADLYNAGAGLPYD